MATTAGEPDAGIGIHPPTHVPGFGTVYWSRRRLDAAAGQFLTTHQPDVSLLSRAGLTRRRRCQYCGQPWSRCQQAKWARRHLSGRQTTITGLGDR